MAAQIYKSNTSMVIDCDFVLCDFLPTVLVKCILYTVYIYIHAYFLNCVIFPIVSNGY